MEFNKKNTKNILLIITFTLVLYVVLQNPSKLFGLIGWILAILFPFILGACIAFIINVPMRFIEHRFFTGRREHIKGKRVIAMITTIIFVLGLIFVVMFLIGPELAKTVSNLVTSIPAAIESFQKWLVGLEIPWPTIKEQITNMEIKWDAVGKDIISFLQNSAGGIFNSTFGVVSSIVSGVTNFFIAFVFAIYILFQKEKLGRQMKQVLYSCLPVKTVERILYITKLSDQTFSNFLTGQCVEAVILGTMFFVTMSIFRFPYALLIGVLIAVSALIPIIGAFIGCAVGIVLILLVSPIQALWFIVLFLILQQIEGNLIYPHVVGGSVGLPSMWVLMAVTLGGSTMGIAGMLINIPLFSVIYALIRETVYQRLKEKKIPDSKWK